MKHFAVLVVLLMVVGMIGAQQANAIFLDGNDCATPGQTITDDADGRGCYTCECTSRKARWYNCIFFIHDCTEDIIDNNGNLLTCRWRWHFGDGLNSPCHQANAHLYGEPAA